MQKPTYSVVRLLNLCCWSSIILSQFACRHVADKAELAHQLKVVEAKGRSLPTDSVKAPLVLPIGKSDLKVIPVKGAPSVIANSNIQAAIERPPLSVGAPTVRVLGQDSTSKPLVSMAVDTQFAIGPREVVIAKDMAIKDPNPANFSYYWKLSGLRHPSVRALIQDKAGNIWIAMRGGGLSRFDGQAFTHFSKLPVVRENRVLALIEDKAGNMWFGSENGGLFKYDGMHLSFLSDQKSAIKGEIRTIMQDQNGNIWCGTTKGGLCKYDGQNYTIYTVKQGLSNNAVKHIIEDRQGNLWIATEGGVNKFDGKSFTQYTKQNGLPDNNIRCLLQDSKGNIWMGTDSAGVIRFDGRQFVNFTPKEGLNSYSISTLLEDRTGSIWMGTEGKGVVKYDGKSFVHYGAREGFPNKDVASILEDRSGNIWFGNYGSLAKLSGIPFTHFTENEGLVFNMNWSILEDRKGNIWLGSQGGISKYDGKQFFRFTTVEGLPKATVRSLAEDRDGNIWMGLGDGTGGFAKFDGKKLYFYKDPFSEKGNAMQDIMQDTAGNMWFANYGLGVYKYDGKSITQYTKEQGLASNITNSLTQDKQGNIWIGTSDGLSKFDGKRFVNYDTHDGLPSKSIWTSVADKAGNLWFGTIGGAVRYDGKYFTAFTQAEGLSEHYPLSLTEDDEGNMWFVTRNGLNKLSKDKARKSYLKPSVNENGIDENTILFKNFEYSDGFLGMGGQSGRTITTDKKGNIWACSNDRVTIYHTSRAVRSIAPPKTRLTGISLFNESVDWTALMQNPDSSFVLGNGVRVGNIRVDSTIKWQALPGGLSLPHDNNYLTFHFTGITMTQSSKVRYRYLLEGNDQNWSSLTSSNRASYGNLSPGSYTFRVKAMSSDGQWSNEYQYQFEVRSPWWATWWAYVVYGAIALTLLRAYVLFRSKQLIKKNLELEQKISQRTVELRESLEQLRSTQSQLIQKEKLASLGELTAGIAHEIQNPLNFVNNFSELSGELLNELKSPLTPDGGIRDGEKIDMDLVEDLTQNLEKINHHGKRASSIVKGMLEHSRMSTGERVLTDLNALADEYLRLSYHGMRAKDKQFNADYELIADKNLPKVKVVPQDIGRVLLNLINNAFYAVHQRNTQGTRPDQAWNPKVVVQTKKLSLQQGEGRSEAIEVTIHDNGPGIPADILPKIFQPFFTTKPTGEGTGLGLSLSYDIITKGHGGTLEVQSTEGEGTTFVVKLSV